MMPTYFKRKFPRLLISFIFILFITEFAFADEITEPIPYRNFIEQNKTWWYRGAIVKGVNEYPYYFGIKIEGDTIIDDMQWSKCWLIDVDKNKILPCPISLIREEDKKIHRYPHDEWLGDAKKEYLNNENNDNIYFRNLVYCWIHTNYDTFNIGYPEYSYTYEDYISSPEDYPLYDFYTEKKQQTWRWSVIFPFDDPSGYSLNGRFEVPRVVADEDGRIFQAHRMLRSYENSDIEPTENLISSEEDYELLIIEGVGINKCAASSSGVFLWPAHYNLEWVYCVYTPLLLMVTIDNDSEVYFRSHGGKDFSLDKAVHRDDIIGTMTNEEYIYDLEGKEIKNPVRGCIYIYNGRKIIWE